MELITFLGACVALYALAGFVLAPWALRRVRRDPGLSSVSWSGLLAMAGALRAIGLVAAVTTAALMLAFFVIDQLGGATSGAVASTLASLQEARDTMLGFGFDWGVAIGGLLVVALCIHAYRRGKRQMSQALARVAEARLEEIRGQMETGTLPELPPTNEMKAVIEKGAELKALGQAAMADQALAAGEREAILEAVEQKIGQLQDIYMHLDIGRRVQPKLSAAEVALPKPRNAFERVQTFLISVGLLRTLGTASRVIYVALLMLLVPSLLGFYAPGTESRVEAATVRLENLRVELELRSARDAFADAAGAPRADTQLSEEDEAALAQLAALFEEASLGADDFDLAPPPIAASALAVRTAAARNAILVRAASRSGGRFGAAGSLVEQIDGLSPAQRATIRAEEARYTRARPRTAAGKAVYERLSEAARSKPGFIDRVKSDLASFQRPASGAQLQRELVVDFLGDDLRAAQRIDARAQRLAMHHEARATRAASRYVGGSASIGEAVHAAGHVDPHLGSLPTRELVDLRSNIQLAIDEQGRSGRDHGRDLGRRLGETPPTARELPRVGSGGSSDPKAMRAVERLRATRLARTGSATQANLVADALARYSDYFPGQSGADLRTPRGRLQMSWNPEFAKSSATRFRRAHSFTRLRGFSRVGGVLIGRDPTEAPGAAALDFRELAWEWSDDRIRLVLRDAAGKRHVTAWHNPRIVQQALVYAADNRPLTVTMTKAEPIDALRILLHPTLVDTPLGFRLIELDRFTDTYTGRDDERARQTRAITGQRLLYELARCARLAELADPSHVFVDELAGIVDKMKLRAALVLAQLVADKDEIGRLLNETLADPDALRDPARAPMAVMHDYYDKNLVRLIQTAATKTSTPKEFAQRIRAAARTEWKQFVAAPSFLAQSYADQLVRWIHQTPEQEPWSGVREADFRVRIEDLLAPADGTAPTGLLRFMVQIAFVSEPVFSADPDAEQVGEPWEYAAVGEAIRQRVDAGIAADSRQLEILGDCREFTILQRLFRTAFAGGLGDGFPFDRLVLLHEELGDRLPEVTCRTPRWNLPVNAIASNELRLALTLIEDLGASNPLEGLGGTGDQASQLRRLGAGVAEVTAGVTGADTIRRHGALLASRLEDAAKLAAVVLPMLGEASRDRAAFDAAWTEYAAASSAWHERWAHLAEELTAARAAPPGAAGDPRRAVLESIAEARELIELYDGLELDDELRYGQQRAIFDRDALPPLK